MGHLWFIQLQQQKLNSTLATKIPENILTIITVREMVSRDTPLKKEAAPMAAKRPGSIHAPYSFV